MEIDRIHIERIWNTKNYTSLRIGAEAKVWEDDAPAVVLRELKAFLDEEGGRLVAEQMNPRPAAAAAPAPLAEEEEDAIPF